LPLLAHGFRNPASCIRRPEPRAQQGVPRDANYIGPSWTYLGVQSPTDDSCCGEFSAARILINMALRTKLATAAQLLGSKGGRARTRALGSEGLSASGHRAIAARWGDQITQADQRRTVNDGDLIPQPLPKMIVTYDQLLVYRDHVLHPMLERGEITTDQFKLTIRRIHRAIERGGSGLARVNEPKRRGATLGKV
jgi:hypothetical protein